MSTCPIESVALRCPCCLGLQDAGLASWHQRCPHCAYESAQLRASINADTRALGETQREHGLRALRQGNFRQVLAKIGEHGSSQHQTLLEVGCGHGWFMELAAQRYAATGIEPDHQIFLVAKAHGVNVVEGYFPRALALHERFDVLVFNDVLEHLDEPESILEACRVALNPGGLLVLNLPTSRGFFYWLAKIAKRFGFAGAFERMWQKDFPSPHLHYFADANLALLLQRSGFRIQSTSTLPALRLSGLYSRIAYAAPARRVRHVLTWLLLVLTFPLVRWLPSDAMLVLAVPHGEPAAD